ncbi:c-type cytochrome [Herbaspirillum sp. alder98]|uniref:c-type cytochrome n=1 Tax=Herbaspirillum sp. alder98 TaxID=2913096 RepID=UPI001CD90514|nr:c-type cytochrome [Herbaspirillum sp. alder98]MCA1323612.1 cytochrome c [Herbaspirillum sp. alder98]
MKTLSKTIQATFAALLCTLTLTAQASTATPTATPAATQADQAVIERGRYLAVASDCIACHTTPRGKPMAGGTSIASPVGAIVATNITPSKQFGIGNYTETQFADALRKGVRADGAHLYPAMPYTAYSVMTDADIHALYLYFMKAVQPVDQATAETSLPFPMNIRLSMKGWNALFLNDKPLAPVADRNEQWLRGRYLAEGPAHCSTCHTPRGFLMQEKLDLQLSGAQVGPWYAPNITPHKTSGIGSWSQAELVTYLKTGRVEGKAQAAGSMAEAITHSFSHLTDDDLQAIAVYILDRPAIADDKSEVQRTRFDQGKAGNALAAFRGLPAGATTDEEVRGARIFSASCASCHGYNGQGTKDGYYPSLYKNSATAGVNPSNLIATILYGVERETKDGGHVFMPPFGNQPNALNSLSNDDVAALSNYVLKYYGNPSVKVTHDDVEVIRQGGPQSNLLLLARIGMVVAGVLVLALLVWLRTRKKRPVRINENDWK